MNLRRRTRYHKVIPVTGYVSGAHYSHILENGAPLAPDHEHEDMDKIRDIIESWPNDPPFFERDMIYARHYEQLSYREIRDRFELGSHETARRRLNKIWATMRAKLQEEGIE